MMKKVTLILAAALLGLALSGAVPHRHSFTVQKVNGVPRIHRDGKVIAPRLFEANTSNFLIWHRHQGGDPAIPAREIAWAHEQGIDLISVVVPLVWPDEPDPKVRQLGIDRIHLIMDHALKANPNAYIVPRMGLHNFDWWSKAYPEHLTTYDNGTQGRFSSFESPVWRKMLKNALKFTIDYLEEHYGPHMAGYHLAGGQWSEWFYEGYGSNDIRWPGYDKFTRAAFQVWLKEKYQTDAALRQAWHDDAVTLATAEPPKGDKLRVHTSPLRAPAEAQQCIDFVTFLSTSTARTIAAIAKETREIAGPGRLIFTFYGYTFAFNDHHASGPGRSGHLVQEAVLDSPDIDVICSPIGYFDRKPGGYPYAQGAAESIMARGKIWLSEDDTPTHKTLLVNKQFPPLGCAQGWRCKDAAETTLVLRRNLAQTYSNNYLIWWMDLHGSGWFDDAALWPEMKKWQSVEKQRLASARPYRPQIAQVVDNASLCHFISQWSGTKINYISTRTLAAQLGHTGAPFGQYLQPDLLAGKFPAVRLALFSTSYALTKTQRSALKAYRKNHGCIWIYAPGYIDLDTGSFSTAAVEETTGFKVKVLQGLTSAVTMTPEGKAWLKPYGAPDRWGSADQKFDSQFPENVYLSPVPQKGDVVLARYTNGMPSTVLRPNGKNPQLFCGSPHLCISILTKIAELAGVKMYTSCGNVAFKNGSYLAITASYDRITVNTHENGRFRDALTGRFLGIGPRFNVTMKRGDTIVVEKDGKIGGEKTF